MKKFKGKAVALAVVFVLAISSLPMLPAKADTPSSTMEKIKQKEQEKQQSEQQKKQQEEQKQQQEQQKEQLEVKQGDLKSKLNELNTELGEAADRMEAVESKIAAKEQEIDETLKELEEAKATEEAQYEAMKKRFKASYEAPKETYLEILIGSSSFSSFLNNTDYLRMVAEYDSRMLDKYQEMKEEVIAKEEVLEEERAELEELKEEIQAEQDRINELIKTTGDYVAQYQAQINTANQEIKEYEAEIAAKELEIKQQEADIAALRAQYERELALSRAAQAAAWRDISQVTFEEGDRVLLANIIYCEAGGEPYEGQLAVGAVVINRVLSSRYPNSVSGVIYQPYQFSPAGSGRLAVAIAENRATASCYQAADQAMAGMSNVGTCLYFRTPLEGMQGTIIGGHIFY
ncbi:MAG: cell wall hydrolase [Lachnospiraceae bacterium]|nr:cell wall hydrolase [Lachnospiraceae bacterium]